MDKIPMTAAGYAALETELKHCQQIERPRIIQQITDARTHGDLSENAEYHAAKEAQSLNEGHIAELEDKLARAEVIDVSQFVPQFVKDVPVSVARRNSVCLFQVLVEVSLHAIIVDQRVIDIE